jgi:hypothetical protein
MYMAYELFVDSFNDYDREWLKLKLRDFSRRCLMAADIYKESPSGGNLSRNEGFHGSERYDLGLSQGTSHDLVRWGPVLAGVFTALSATTVLSVLGLAIGFSSIDPNDTLRSFGIGAGVWGAATALISFFLGGWISGRTTALVDNFTRVLQGSMVWIVTIPLLLYVIAGGAGAMFRTLGGVVQTGVQAAAPIAGQAAGQGAQPAPGQPGREGAPLGQQAQDAARQAQDTARQAVENLRQQVTPERVERTAEVASKAAWSVLFSMILGLVASAFGGYVASRRQVVQEMPVSTTGPTQQPYH